MLRIFKKLVRTSEGTRRGRVLSLLLVAVGSGRFWALTAAAATVAAVSVVLYLEIHAELGDAGSYGYRRLGRERVLLMNVDNLADCPVTFESYAYNQSVSIFLRRNYEAFWTFVEKDTVSLYNLKNNASTELHVSDKGNPGKRLWSLRNCRHGNTHSSDPEFQKVSNYLPVSPTSLGIGSTSTAASNQATDDTAGQIVMQNTPAAEVISSCYAEGIGTVYFDAVNAFTGYKNGQIAVEVAYGVFKTNTTGQVVSRRIPDDLERDAEGNFVPPDDAHCDEVRYVEQTEGSEVTETTPFGRLAWVRVNLTGAWRCNGAAGVIATNDVLALRMPESGTAAGAKENFYRVWAPVADPVVNPATAELARGPMRFRIRRLDDPNDTPGLSGISLDGENLGLRASAQQYNGLLLIDNVIASYPAMKAWAIPAESRYVGGGSARNVIGWTGALDTRFAAVGERGLRATAALALATNAVPGVSDEWVAGVRASMSWRWRYMNQSVGDWATLALAMEGDRLVSAAALDLPGAAGDIEFRYETELDAPYYAYLDYSGSTALMGTPGYSERIQRVLSRLNPAARGQAGGIPAQLPSRGDDFFFRLREGKSDQLEFRLDVRIPGETAPLLTEPCWLTGDGVWRTYLRTTTNELDRASIRNRLPRGQYEFRVRGVDPNVVYAAAAAVSAVPVSAQRLLAGDAWAPLEVDSATDALRFDLFEDATSPEVMTFSVVHASFQDFNLWNDAVNDDKTYTGAYFEGRGKQSGSSPDTREYPSELAGWNPPAAANDAYWREAFAPDAGQTPLAGYAGYPAYERFGRAATPNGWNAINSMWICGQYRESVKDGDMALQLGGWGDGSLEYVNSARLPRGVDAVAFKARVAQEQTFDGFAYSFGGELKDMRDYLVTVRAVLSTTAASTEFDGNGSVSIVGYYQPGEGCYELRAERIAANTVRLYLYKWRRAGRSVKAQLLGYHANTLAYQSQTYLRCSNNGLTAADQTSAYYGELFMRCRTVDGQAQITAGIMNAQRRLGDSGSGYSHYYFTYTDDDPGNELTFGTYGFGALNAPAQIIKPEFYANGAGGNFPAVSGQPRDAAGAAINRANFRCGSAAVTYPPDSGAVNAFLRKLGAKYENWVFSSGVFEAVEVGGYKAIQSIPPTGEAEVFVTPSGGKEYSAGRVAVAGFRNQDCEIPVRNTQDSLVRIATGPDSGDVVVDDVRFGQWCAASYDDTNSRGDFSNVDFDDKLPGLGCPTNYVYLNGWVQTAGEGRTLDLQPARATHKETDGDLPVGFRAPLMDGRDGRGIGLGVISYTYKNADRRCRLLVQYRADIDGTTYLRTRTAALDGWTTVATNDFSAEGVNLTEGTVTTYVGRHGERGAMRVIVDPQVVKNAQNETLNQPYDPTYGQITITEFRASDEPPLYGLYWWGWNIRTSDDDAERSFYDSDETAAGLSIALNNSVTADTERWSPDETDDERQQRFARHVPFVQSPTFYTNLVNEVSFRARKLRADDPDTEIAILGAADAGVSQDSEWRHLKTIVVDSASFETYSFKVKASEGFRSFRLAVIGVAGVETNWKDKMEISAAQRILLDEVSVSEGIYGKIGLFDIGAFRTPIDEHVYVPDVTTDKTQQPMCEEAWSVQCEVRAVQLADEIKLDDTTEVWLHWYVGTDKWGYGKWGDAAAAKSAKLARVEGQPGFVYRGSYSKAPGAIVDPVYDSGAVVQYMLEVRYKNADGSDADAYFMTAGDWKKPDWYRGVDYNARYGGFAGYTILDYVAYGYAWINEVNLFDIGRTSTGEESLYADPRTNQFVEVAVPSEANIKGWKLQFITGGLSDTAELYTNTVVTFSDPAVIPNGVPCKKTLNMDPASKYVFITAGSPASCNDSMKAKGYIDGPWSVEGQHGSQIEDNGSVDIGMPLGIRLVRPSGIVEHQIVVAGTNRYATYRQPYPRTYSATNFVAKLNASDPDKAWYTPWCEDRGTNATLAIGVTNFVGVITDRNVWAHLGKTPGRINLGESIPSEHPHPMGAMLVLYAQLEGGSIEQSVGGEGPTTNNLVLYVRKGLPNGTNIVYDVDNWYELESVAETTDGATTVHPVGQPGRYVFQTKAYASNDITVVANAGVRRDLTETYGLTADNAFTPAVLAWLARGISGKTPAPFANPGGEIRLAEAHDFADNYVCDLSLTEMYWLDMDPTVGGTVLQAGMSAAPYPVEVVRSGAGGATVNCRDGVVEAMMKIYSKTGAFAPYAPYTLNGLAPGSSSRENAAGWDAPTFKITFHLLNGLDDNKDPDMIWMPVRYFVFDDDSFGPDFKATIQVMDPFYQFSDWEEWKDRLQPGEDLMYKFTIDTRKFGAVGNDVLRPDSTYPRSGD